MKYFQLNFNIKPCSDDAADVLSALLAEIGFETFVPANEGLTAYIQQSLFDKDALQKVIDNFIIPGITLKYQLTEAPDEDWNQVWEEEGFQPILIDELICVHDTRHPVLSPCQYDITINPRMAFGTGTHPTTQQILRHLSEADLQGLNVVDAGCGTGVLGFLASMRGARQVFAYDIDAWSVENTRINAALNGIENIEVSEGDASVLPQDGRFDLLIANINRNILLNDLPRFANTLKPNAQMLLSGFYESDAQLLIERAAAFGFNPVKQTSVDDWTMLLLKR